MPSASTDLYLLKKAVPKAWRLIFPCFYSYKGDILSYNLLNSQISPNLSWFIEAEEMLNRVFCSCNFWLLKNDIYVCVVLTPYLAHRNWLKEGHLCFLKKDVWRRTIAGVLEVFSVHSLKQVPWKPWISCLTCLGFSVLFLKLR